ncbi:MAG: right-handed parallel beta-helix repeat-containing protein [Candidatus Eisenbacteria bacterium]
MKRFIRIMILAGVCLVPSLVPGNGFPEPAGAATLEVSAPLQITRNGHYERGQSVIADDGGYWIFFGRSANETGTYATGNPDVHDYQIYYKRAMTVPQLTEGSAFPVPNALNSYLGETGAAYFGGQVWVFATLDRDGVYTPAADCDLYGWYTTNAGTNWTQVGPIIADIGDGQAHHDEIVFDGELWVLEGHGDFTTIRSATPAAGGWTSPISIGALSGGIGRFFIAPQSFYPAPGGPGPALCVAIFSEHWSYIYQWDNTGDAWVQLDAVSDPRAYDPALFQVAGRFVFADAPMPADWSKQWIAARNDTTLVGLLSASATPTTITAGGYGSAVWIDMWPIGFTDMTGTSYLFYTSERDTPTQAGDGNIWCLQVDWPIERDHYTFIQVGVDNAAAGDIVHVSAGTYNENLLIDRSLTLDGAGRDLVTVYPAVSDIGGTGGPSFGYSQLAVIEATGVTLRGLTFDGDSPDLTPLGQLDARNGVITNYNTGDWNDLVVEDCTVRNLYLRGIYASAQSALTGVRFIGNIVEHIRGVSYQSAGVMFYRTHGQIEENVVSDCSIGIMHHTLSSGYIERNTVSDCDNCIAVNSNAAPTQVMSNDVIDYVDSGIQTVEPHGYIEIFNNDIYSAVTPGLYDQFAIYIFGQYSGYTGDQRITGNRLGTSAALPGIPERATASAVRRPPLALQAASPQEPGSRELLRYGIGIDTYGWSSSMDVHARIRGNEIRGMDYGILLCDAAGNPAPWMDVTIGGSFMYSNLFAANTYEELALLTIDDDIAAQYNDWGTADELLIENEIWHQVDDPALGLVDFSNFISAQDVDPIVDGARSPWMIGPLPNPFGESTRMILGLAAGATAEISIYAIDGRRVAHQSWAGAAERQVVFAWEGTDPGGVRLPAGIYFLRARVGEEQRETRVMRVE